METVKSVLIKDKRDGENAEFLRMAREQKKNKHPKLVYRGNGCRVDDDVDYEELRLLRINWKSNLEDEDPAKEKEAKTDDKIEEARMEKKAVEATRGKEAAGVADEEAPPPDFERAPA